MEPVLTELVVMRMDAEPPAQHVATIAGGQGELLVVRVDETIAWCRGEAILVVAGAPGERMFVQGVYVNPSGKFHMIRRISAWKRFDQRDDERFETRIPVRLRAASGWRADATVEDISGGGMAIQVLAEPRDVHLTVDIMANGYRSELPIDVLSMSDRAGGNVLHCRFRDLTAPQTAFLRSLLAELAELNAAKAA